MTDQHRHYLQLKHTNIYILHEEKQLEIMYRRKKYSIHKNVLRMCSTAVKWLRLSINSYCFQQTYLLQDTRDTPHPHHTVLHAGLPRSLSVYPVAFDSYHELKLNVSWQQSLGKQHG